MTFERWTDRTVPMATDRRSRMHPDFPVEVWACLNPAHRSVTWVNDLARCDACGLTSEMTREFTEGTELARVQAIAADLDGFIGRRAAELAKPAIERGTEVAVRADERRKCAEEIRVAAQGIDTLGSMMLVRAATLDAADIIDPPARKTVPGA